MNNTYKHIKERESYGKVPLVMLYKPKEDITSYQLALLMEIFVIGKIYYTIEEIPLIILKHIEII